MLIQVFRMWRNMIRYLILGYVICSFSVTSIPAMAAVVDADVNGFTVAHRTSISADRMAVYKAAIENVDEWWSSDHTVSANAANLYFDARLQGCLCESLGQSAGLVHMTVTFVNPGVMLRLTGGLGPLGLMGVAGNMTWEFDDSEEGTTVTLNYAVGGYMSGGLDSIASAVDGVLIEAMTRLKSFVETGSPDAPTS
jgi:hypothetical protein